MPSDYPTARFSMKEEMHDTRARKEYEAIRGFYVHVMVFVPVMLLLVVLDVLGGSGTPSGSVSAGDLGFSRSTRSFVLKPLKSARWEQAQIEAAVLKRRGSQSPSTQKNPVREAEHRASSGTDLTCNRQGSLTASA